MSKPSKKRILQIINNIAEEYVDLKQTDFANKEELCEVILYLRKESTENFHLATGVVQRIGLLWMQENKALWENPKKKKK